MARAKTAKFHDVILEVEFATGTFSAVCGLTEWSINRSSNLEEAEIPDCDDPSLPMAVEVAVRSQSVTVTGTGTWAMQSHEKMLDWWNAGTPLNARIRYANVTASGATGDTTMESGPAVLASLNNGAAYGQRFTADIELRFDGVPTRTAKA